MLVGLVGLAWANMLARRGQAAYLFFTVAFSTAALLLLATLNPRAIPQGISDLIVLDAKGGLLPLRYAETIRSLPGVLEVYYLTFLPVQCATGATATLNGYGGEGTDAMLLAGYAVGRQVVKRWNDDPLGILVGERLAQQCNWRKGMSIVPRDGFLGREVEIHVVDVIKSNDQAPFANQIAFAHYEYLNRLMEDGERDFVRSIGVQVKDASRTAQAAARIDSAFAHSNPPTDTQQANSQEDGLLRFGDIRLLVDLIVVCMTICLSLVITILLAHSAIGRRSMFAVFRVLGFSRRFVLASFVAEYGVVALAGHLAGVLAGILAVDVLVARVGPLVGELSVPASTYILVTLVVGAVFAISLLIPAVLIFRARAIDCQTR